MAAALARLARTEIMVNDRESVRGSECMSVVLYEEEVQETRRKM
jgi:hypothetical protein